ncbi:GGDEF domain-containing protein [Thalassotalea fusca]
MDNASFQSIIYLLNITLSCVASALFFIFNPLRIEKDYRVVIRYFVALFSFMAIAYAVYLFRPFMPVLLSIAFANIFYGFSFHCLRYGLMWRKRTTTKHIYADKWVYLHLGYLAWSNCYLFFMLYDSLVLRAMNALFNTFIIYMLCIPHVAKNQLQPTTGEVRAKYVFIALGVLNALMVIPYALTQTPFVYTSSLLILLTIQSIALLGALLTLLLSDVIEMHYKNSVTDALTSLYNRRFFMEQANSLIKSAQRHKFPMSLIMCDIDDFKKINDTYGHDTGDKVLTEFAQSLKLLTREDDLLARFGGEEFIALLPQTSIEGGQTLAQRMCDHTAKLNIKIDDQPIQFTASFGVATFNSRDNLEQNLKYADEALYQAKENGKNQVQVAQHKISAIADS